MSSQRDQDPYNQPQANYTSANQRPMHQYPEQADLLRYDSMSTILEVDSECTGSELSERLGSPVPIRTGRSPGGSQVSPLSGVSPVERFSGALNALAEQVERLRAGQQRDSATASTKDSERNDTPNSHRQTPSEATTSSKNSGHQDAPTSPVSSASSTTPTLESQGSESGDDVPVEPDHESVQRHRSRQLAGSAESLMMISMSPIGSPRIKLPAIRLASVADERRVVEVSNKSTLTNIDLALMDQMVEKYFVERSDKATQPVSFDTIGVGGRDGSLLRRPAGGRPTLRSVAVGTENFSRERFSLLPPTKTRSTQTKANIENDFGASETRRFRLNHLELGQVMRRPQARDASTEPEAQVETEKLDNREVVQQAESREEQLERDNKQVVEEQLRSSEPVAETARKPILRFSPEFEAPLEVARSQTPNAQKSASRPSSKADSLSRFSSGNSPTREKVNSDAIVRDSPSPATSSGSESNTESPTPPDSLRVSKSKITGEGKIPDNSSAADKHPAGDWSTESCDIIPNVKTELRVIIEIKDSRQQQFSEVVSNSQLIDGKLSKLTQVSTSKQVASPREVLDRLQSAGRKHSLMYQPSTGQARATVIDGANQDAPYWSSATSLGNARPASGKHGYESIWREVSNSSVANEIETNTRAKRREETADGREEIVMISDATISNLGADKSAIELHSRAARRQEVIERDPSTNQLIRTGRTREKTLVESEVGFNENQLRRGTEEHPGAQVKPSTTPVPANQTQPASLLEKARTSPVSSHIQNKHLPRQPEPEARSPAAEFKQVPRAQTQRTYQQQKQQQGMESSKLSPNPRIVIEEQSEDHHAVTRNGQVVYDDRLSERKYEVHRASSHPMSCPRPVQSTPTCQGSPLNTVTGILRNRNQAASQRQLLKPISLRPSRRETPLVVADQTSYLSSDPETMDSGFAQSAVGSSSALNQSQQQSVAVYSPEEAPGSHRLQQQQQFRRQPRPARKEQLEEPRSLNFVDDDADELIDQLGRSRTLSAPVVKESSRPGTRLASHRSTLNLRRVQELQQPRSQQLARQSLSQTRVKAPWDPSKRRTLDDQPHLILPPPAFRSSEPALNKLDSEPVAFRKSDYLESEAKATAAVHPTDTELVTCLTRTKRAPQVYAEVKPFRVQRGTLTRLEQSVLAPDGELAPSLHRRLPGAIATLGAKMCRFKAQVLFESDTDSMNERLSAVSSRSSATTVTTGALDSGTAGPPALKEGRRRDRKELVSETKYSRSDAGAGGLEPVASSEATPGGAQTGASSVGLRGLQPKWDYSLRVNRMRGSKVDSTVNTHIRHSRQALMNPS